MDRSLACSFRTVTYSLAQAAGSSSKSIAFTICVPQPPVTEWSRIYYSHQPLKPHSRAPLHPSLRSEASSMPSPNKFPTSFGHWQCKATPLHLRKKNNSLLLYLLQWLLLLQYLPVTTSNVLDPHLNQPVFPFTNPSQISPSWHLNPQSTNLLKPPKYEKKLKNNQKENALWFYRLRYLSFVRCECHKLIGCGRHACL